MYIDLPNLPAIYAYTGGRPFNPTQPTLLLIHGVLNDHSVWILQSRYVAHHGWNVLAVDLPGHGRSPGPMPDSVEALADRMGLLLDALNLSRVAVAGHSMGSLIALELAARRSAHVSHLALLATASPMKVSPTLLEWSASDPERAIELVNTFSHATLAPPPSALGPGTWLYGASRALMRRVLASNPAEPIFQRGFQACDRYTNAAKTIKDVSCPVLLLRGDNDQMTPPKATAALVGNAHVKVHDVPAGHSLMTEAPDAVLDALRNFLPLGTAALNA